MKALLFILLAIASVETYGQVADNTNRRNDRNVYYCALTQYLHFRDTSSYYSTLDKLDTIYVENSIWVGTDSLLNDIGSTRIIVIDNPYDFIMRHRRKGITLYRIFPLDFRKGDFSIGFVPFGVTAKKKKGRKHLFYSNPGGYRVYFKFENKQFHSIRVEDHSI